MRRNVYIFLCVLFTLLATAAVALSAESYRRSRSVSYAWNSDYASHAVAAEMKQGRLGFGVELKQGVHSNTGFDASADKYDGIDGFEWAATGSRHQALGFRMYKIDLHYSGASGLELYALELPGWFVVLLFVLAAVMTGRASRKRAKPIGLCPKCGYNLTGNASGVCPECGVAVKTECSI